MSKVLTSLLYSNPGEVWNLPNSDVSADLNASDILFPPIIRSELDAQANVSSDKLKKSIDTVDGQITRHQEESLVDIFINRKHSTKSVDIKERTQKVVGGSQFRVPTKGLPRCDQCSSLFQSLTKLKDANRSLKLQISQLHARVTEMSRNKSNGPGVSSEYNGLMEAARNELLVRCEGLTDDLAVCKKRNQEVERALAEERLSYGALSDELKAVKRDMCQNKNFEQRATEKIIFEKDKVIYDLEVALKEKNRQLHEKDLELISRSEDILRLRKESEQQLLILDKKGRDVDKLEQAYSEKSAEVEHLLRELQTSHQRCQYSELALSQENDRRSEQEKRTRELESELESMHHERTAMQSNERKILQLTDQLRDQLSAATSRADEAFNRERVLLGRMADASDATRLALEKAISSSVRLCVVAPKVNVHIADNNAIAIASGVSDGALRDFLKTEVMENYSFLFKQMTENASPEAGVTIQDWIRVMLQRMQASIESHVMTALADTASEATQ